MTGPRDLVDDHVARPALGAVAVELLAIGRDLDRRADLADQLELDARRLPIAPRGETMLDRGQPAPRVAADLAGQRAEAGEDRA